MPASYKQPMTGLLSSSPSSEPSNGGLKAAATQVLSSLETDSSYKFTPKSIPADGYGVTTQEIQMF